MTRRQPHTVAERIEARIRTAARPRHADDGPSTHADRVTTLAIHRPQTPAEWDAWHARRDGARRVVANRAVDADDRAELLDALGLDPANEERLVRQLVRWS